MASTAWFSCYNFMVLKIKTKDDGLLCGSYAMGALRPPSDLRHFNGLFLFQQFLHHARIGKR
ncbi:hypothetical protein JOE09_002157 [Pantoea coffeiphila]|nr:hypothetical protein [Pantoea coffeiphila]